MNVGTTIGNKYKIEKELNRGGFGIIYQGTDETFGKAVAIKAVAPKLLDEAMYIDMFQQEAVNVAQLNHQNIVQVLDIKREADGVFIIMELIDGFDLLTILKACRKADTPLPTQLGAYIIAEVCNGLHYAHNRRNPETNEALNLVHQDISPMNIMLNRNGEIKIIDFGMANFRRQQKQKRGEVQIQGNIRYLAPEQIKQTGTIDCRTDIFALGVILFEFLTGERLIPSPNMQEIIESTLMGEYDLSRLERDDIPERLQQIAQKALQRNASNRYPSANHMYRDLMHYLILTAPAADFMNDLAAFIAEMQPELLADAANKVTDEPDSVQPHSQSEIEAERTEHTPVVKSGEQERVFAFEDPPSTNAPEEPSQQGSEKVFAMPGTIALGEEQENANEGLQIGPLQKKEISPVFKTVEAEQDSPNAFYSFVEDTDEDDQKTIIDVVRLSARTHRKAIIATILTFALTLVSFTVVDTFAHMTPMGATIYDFFFPPAIGIVSVPAGANVYLDDKLLEETTPLALAEISPGIHKLMLSLPQYQSIVKSINVPRKGELHLSGEAQRRANQPYVLRFKAQFDIVSQPGGAQITIDGVKMNQQTPATIFWDVTEKPTAIELAIPGLPRLAGLSINSIDDEEYISDNRIWKIAKPIEGLAHYVTEGIFHKNFTINSRPKFADLYVDGSERPMGVTGVNGSLMLKIGQHSFTLKKDGYISKTFVVDINEETPAAMNKDLLRRVRIFAKDVQSGNGDDLGAKLVDLRLNQKRVTYRRKTPVMVELLPYTYKAKLTKKGYHDLSIKISPTDKSVVAKMTPLFSEMTVETIDAITSSPISSAEIIYRPTERGTSEEVLGTTNSNGRIVGKLLPGAYEVIVSKSGYQTQRKTIQLQSNLENRLTFRLAAMRN